MDAVARLLDELDENPAPEDVGRIDNRTIDGPDGDIDIRIYWPASATKEEKLPVTLYVHGGGWVLSSIDGYDRSARAVCSAAHCVVVSTEYRRGPEHRYPAAHDDVFAAYKWVLQNAETIGGDASRVAVLGESAGGNLAANVCMRARDESVQAPVCQVLVYPVAGYNFDTPSYREMTDAIPLSSPMMPWFFQNYLNNTAEGALPAISLDRADLSDLPPATIICAELDPLRSEGEELARQFMGSGVAARQRTYNGVTHEFFGMRDVLQESEDAIIFAAEGLMAAFGTDRRDGILSRP
jgi:acetyl esterase/lipase